MRRREFMAMIGGVITWPLVARAQDQVHRHGRGGDPSRGDKWDVHGGRLRYRAWYRRSRSGQDLRRVPAGGQLDHAQEGRHRPGSLYRQAHHRDAWGPDLGRIRTGQRIDVLFHTAGAGRSTSGTVMSQRILVVEDQADTAMSSRALT